MRLRRIGLKQANLLDDPTILKVGVNIDSAVQKTIAPTIITRKHLRDKSGELYRGIAVFKPDNKPLFVFLPNAIEESIWLPAYKLLNTVKGGLDNRPGVIGENMRLERRRKSGEVGKFKAVPLGVMKTIKGKAGTLGPYRSEKPKPNGTHCERTAWTLQKPQVWLGV